MDRNPRCARSRVEQSIQQRPVSVCVGGVGIGYSLHAGQVTVADGSEMMAKRIERVLTTDPGMGIIRHADAGYEEAKQFAKKTGVKVPMETK